MTEKTNANKKQRKKSYADMEQLQARSEAEDRADSELRNVGLTITALNAELKKITGCSKKSPSRNLK